MATVLHTRIKRLQDKGTRLLPVQLPSDYTTTGDHQGTWNTLGQTVHRNDQVQLSVTGQLLNAGGGALTSLNDVGGNYTGFWNSLGQTVHRNDQITLSSNGVLNNAGGGAITNLDYGNVGGSKPPSNATANFFSTSGSNPSGGSDGDAHWNSSTSTMWFKTGGVWRVGGTINANQITVGTLAAARIASNSVTTDKLNVGQLSDITTNIGSVATGTLGGSSNVTVSGVARFNGFTTSGLGTASIVCNDSGNTSFGIVAFGSSAGVTAQTSGGAAIQGRSTGSGAGVRAIAAGSGPALDVLGDVDISGSISISTQTISNLTAGAANFVSGSNVSGTVASATNAANATNSSNTSAMNGISSSGWCRFMVTNSGTATASSTGFVFTSTVTGVRTRATGGRNFVVEEFSDEELKINEVPEDLGLDFILGLQPVTYEREDTPGITYHGIGARKTRAHLEKIKKRKNNDTLGRTLEDGTESSSTIGLIAPMVKAMQEMNELINELQREVISLNAQLQELTTPKKEK